MHYLVTVTSQFRQNRLQVWATLNMAISIKIGGSLQLFDSDLVEQRTLKYTLQTGHLQQHAQPLNIADWMPAIDL